MRLPVTNVFLFAVMVGCGASPPILVQRSGVVADDEADAGYVPVPHRADDSSASDTLEERPGGAEEPALENTPAPLPSPVPLPSAVPLPSPTAGEGGDEARFGVGENQTCSDHVAQYWKVGAFTREEYKISKFIFTATLTMRTTVTAVSGSRVTVHSEFDAPDTENDTQGDTTFDACSEGWKITVPNGFMGCTLADLGFEAIRVNGVDYRARKMKVADCRDAEGKTLDTIVWRVPELPLWGIVKREAKGTYIPDKVDGKLLPTTKEFSFN